MNYRTIVNVLQIIFFLLSLTTYLVVGSSAQDVPPAQEGYGFVGDGKTMNTNVLQRAIDECSQKGGGTVSLPAGNYLSGTIVLKKGVTLHLEKDAVLLGSRDIADYPGEGRRKSLIFAESADDISITGDGEINGSSQRWEGGDSTTNRPLLINLFSCKNVKVNGVTMKNAGFWTFRFVRCDGVDIRKVTVESHVNWNNDGFDIESRNVYISDCTFDADDDAICFKSEYRDFVVENIVVENCKVSSNCNFIKFGTASAGGFRNITVKNCTLYKCSQTNLRFWDRRLPGVAGASGITNPITGIAGIALEVVDGGFMENIHISNIRMEDVQTPIFIRLGKRGISEKSWLKDILIEDITASSASFVASSITGVPGLRVENVEIRNSVFQLKGGGKISDTSMDVPEVEARYPENRMFGVILPAYGFYLRHADNIRFDNIKLSYTGGSEERHVFVADDVTNLEIKNSILQPPSSNKSVIFLRSCKDIRLLENRLGIEPILEPIRYADGVNTQDSEIEIKEYVPPK